MDTALDTFPLTRNFHQHNYTYYPSHYFTPGILHTTLFPSFAFHAALALPTYAIARTSRRIDTKAILRPAAPLLNAWYSAVGRHLLAGMPLRTAFGRLSRPEWLVLGGVTLWGGRALAQAGTRAARRDDDDLQPKREAGFWDGAALAAMAGEVAAGAVVALPVVAPFRDQSGVLTGYSPVLQAVAVGVYVAGMLLEGVAEAQAQGRRRRGERGACQTGVWGLCRRPDAVGDRLVQWSFVGLLFASDMLSPMYLAGPVVGYFMTRHGEREGQGQGQETREIKDSESAEAKKSGWPGVKELGNPWLWAIVGGGAVGAAAEWALAAYTGY